MDIRFENKVPTIKLNNGMEMPQLGVGTFLVKEDAPERVCHAIKAGFRLIDTAQGYGNEKEVLECHAQLFRFCGGGTPGTAALQ